MKEIKEMINKNDLLLQENNQLKNTVSNLQKQQEQQANEINQLKSNLQSQQKQTNANSQNIDFYFPDDQSFTSSQIFNNNQFEPNFSNPELESLRAENQRLKDSQKQWQNTQLQLVSIQQENDSLKRELQQLIANNNNNKDSIIDLLPTKNGR